MIINVLLLFCILLLSIRIFKQYCEYCKLSHRICKYDIVDECYEEPLNVYVINHPFVEVIECSD